MLHANLYVRPVKLFCISSHHCVAVLRAPREHAGRPAGRWSAVLEYSESIVLRYSAELYYMYFDVQLRARAVCVLAARLKLGLALAIAEFYMPQVQREVSSVAAHAAWVAAAVVSDWRFNARG